MSVASKNPYDLLGNGDGDVDAAPAPAPAVKDVKPQTAPRRAAGNDAAYRDRNAGSDRNRTKPTDEAPRGGARGGREARVRGGRGGRFPRERDDRHSKGLPGTTGKHAGGDTEGDAERKDEDAGEAIAKADEKEAIVEDATAADEEPEEKQLTLDAYLAQQAEKKLALSDAQLAVRQANEGTKTDKKWSSAKPLVKEDDSDFISGSGGKPKRERERKVKLVVEIDQRYVEPERPHGGEFRGGPRGGGRGGRGRGGERGEFRGGRGGGERGDRSEFRGERGERAERGERGEFRGRGGPRGGPRGGARGRGEPRGAFRGAPQGVSRGAELNPKDESAFPSLGSN